ncbi:MAG: exodeoxyribonuclease V subunit beta [Pseudomonadales bacterium]|nr:exodeoxyribonuclease V subunit beta [Pseudomonadales bacterium]
MTVKSNLLKPMAFSLQGKHLIEASAGTGKTYTITSLYLRLLLGHGDLFTGFGRPLNVDEILLVTFTSAATQELKGRIRDRIHQAKRAFLRGSVKGDDFLSELLADFPKQSYPHLILRLDLAEQQMDEASIFTIHGFCQRMLKQNAFECGVLFDMNLVKDEQKIRETASFDFWRETMYSLKSEHMAVVNQYWPSPQNFMASIQSMVNREGLNITPPIPKNSFNSESGVLNTSLMIAETLDEWLENLRAFKQHWLEERKNIEEIIQQSDVNKRSYGKKTLPNWLAVIDGFCNDKQAFKLPEKLAKFSQRELSEKTTKGNAPAHPLFTEIENLIDTPLPLKELIQHAGILDIRQRIDNLKNQQQVFGFSDLLTQLNNALRSDLGPELAKRIRTLYPVAMIDEFQDTDLTQYGTFERIYFDAPDCGAYLIGDPKQAIYSFRNADIFTYMRAKQEIPDHYHLDTNWRSTHAMVDASNHLFEFSDRPFIYDQAIPFLSVNSGGMADKTPLNIAGSQQQNAALQFFLLEGDKPFNKKTYQHHQAQCCANEITSLLNAGVRGDATIGKEKLANEDIAVLVRDRYEAGLIREQLEQRNIDVVYLSTKGGVFSSDEAADLYLLLVAVASLCGSSNEDVWGSQGTVSADEKAIRSALATRLFHYSLAELESLIFQEAQWEKILQEFAHYQEVWASLGVLPMLHQIFHRRDVMARVQRFGNAERRLTNILHISELLQSAASELSGEKELLVWFGNQIESQEQAADDALLRLESDRKRVQIVTIHKSKGLEYPIVFIPFACSYKAAKVALYQDETTQQKVLDLSASENALENAEKERLAEDLRLLYVALTRSKYRSYLGVADIRVGNKKTSDLAKTALGYLLLNDDSDSLGEQLNKLTSACRNILVRRIETEEQNPEKQGRLQTFTPQHKQAESLHAKQFTAGMERNWRVSSFTALTRNASHKAHHINDNLLSEQLDLDAMQDATENNSAPLINDKQSRTIFTFPKGAQAGTMMHSLFEEIDFTAIEQTGLQKSVEEKLLLSGFDAEWCDVLVNLIYEVLETPLNTDKHQEAGLCLNLIPNNKRFVELEFTLPMALIKSRTLQELEQQIHPSIEYSNLEFFPQRGYIKGFIDLIIEWQGQYFILDYKSNYLGDTLEDYHPDNLVDAMVEHHYPLQYLLYSLALHRYLKQRLGDYDYQTHFGGVYYLFLRGMRKDQPGSGVYFNKPDQHIIDELDDALLGEATDV